MPAYEDLKDKEKTFEELFSTVKELFEKGDMAGIIEITYDLKEILEDPILRRVIEDKFGQSTIQEAEEYIRLYDEYYECLDDYLTFPKTYHSRVCLPIFERLRKGILDPNDEQFVEMIYNMTPNELAEYLADRYLEEKHPNIDPRIKERVKKHISERFIKYANKFCRESFFYGDSTPHAYDYIRFLKQYPSEVRNALKKIMNREMPTPDELRSLYNFYESLNGFIVLPFMTDSEASTIQLLNEVYEDLHDTIEHIENCIDDALNFIYTDEDENTFLFITLGVEAYWEHVENNEKCATFLAENVDNPENVIIKSLQNSYDPFINELIIQTVKAARPDLWEDIVRTTREVKRGIWDKAEEIKNKHEVVKTLEEKYKKVEDAVDSFSPEDPSSYYRLKDAIDEFYSTYNSYNIDVDYLCRGRHRLCYYIEGVEKLQKKLETIHYYLGEDMQELINNISDNIGRDDVAAALAAYELYKYIHNKPGHIYSLEYADVKSTASNLPVKSLLEDLLYKKTGLRLDEIDRFVIEKAREYCENVNDIDHAAEVLRDVYDGREPRC